MAKPKNFSITVEMLSEEDFENLFADLTEEEFEAKLEELDNVETIDEFIDVLKSVGMTVTEEEICEESPGPNDTIH